MMKADRWLIIVNRTAGGGKAEADWPHIDQLLRKHGFTFDVEFTDRRLHAMVIARNKVIEGYNRIIVVGGDGTMNEVINGIFYQDRIPTAEIMLGMISVGTGNDWGKMFNIPAEY